MGEYDMLIMDESHQEASILLILNAVRDSR